MGFVRFQQLFNFLKKNFMRDMIRLYASFKQRKFETSTQSS